MKSRTEIKARVRWSNQVILTSVIVSLILIGAEVQLCSNIVTDYDPIKLFFALLILLISVQFILLAPLSIRLEEHRLVLKRVEGSLTVRYDQIRAITPFEMSIRDFRIWGSGGFWGFTGLFFNKHVGKYKAYIGNPNQAFMIATTSGKLFAFSCENRDAILQAIKEKAKQMYVAG